MHTVLTYKKSERIDKEKMLDRPAKTDPLQKNIIQGQRLFEYFLQVDFSGYFRINCYGRFVDLKDA